MEGIKEPSGACLPTWVGLVNCPASRQGYQDRSDCGHDSPHVDVGGITAHQSASPDEICALQCEDDTHEDHTAPTIKIVSFREFVNN